MKNFLDESFLLSSPTAQYLYSEYAAKMPIIDYHCHINPKEIFCNRSFENITQMWLEGDHYKWRIMRSNGIDERYITGNASDKEKFLHFASALERCIGNPMYHWCHLELRNYFGYNGELNSQTAPMVWEHSLAKLAGGSMTVRDLIKKSNVYFIGSTDEATDSLEWHEKIREENIQGLTVAPSFRPDKIINIDKPIWKENIEKLSEVSGIKLTSIENIKKALLKRIEFFDELGCRASDHGLDYVCFERKESNTLNEIISRALNGQVISQSEAEAFKTELVLFCAESYNRLGWVMQIHFNCMRNPNTAMHKELGVDIGLDIINTVNCSNALVLLLDELYKNNMLPKTVLYSLNPVDNAFLDTLIGAFQGAGVQGKLQHGSAWWFNDTKTGMQEQLTSLANLSILGNFIGMLTDSRSFLSYARHEYFRRILCELIGSWIENGEFSQDLERAGKLIEDISFNNAKKYFDI